MATKIRLGKDAPATVRGYLKRAERTDGLEPDVPTLHRDVAEAKVGDTGRAFTFSLPVYYDSTGPYVPFYTQAEIESFLAGLL